VILFNFLGDPHGIESVIDQRSTLIGIEANYPIHRTFSYQGATGMALQGVSIVANDSIVDLVFKIDGRLHIIYSRDETVNIGGVGIGSPLSLLKEKIGHGEKWNSQFFGLGVKSKNNVFLLDKQATVNGIVWTEMQTCSYGRAATYWFREVKEKTLEIGMHTDDVFELFPMRYERTDYTEKYFTDYDEMETALDEGPRYDDGTTQDVVTILVEDVLFNLTFTADDHLETIATSDPTFRDRRNLGPGSTIEAVLQSFNCFQISFPDPRVSGTYLLDTGDFQFVVVKQDNVSMTERDLVSTIRYLRFSTRDIGWVSDPACGFCWEAIN